MRTDCFIHPTAEVSDRASVGAGTRIWNQAQVRDDAVIGERCIIGKDVFVDQGVIVGNGVKVQNGVSIYRGVTVEDDAFLGPHMVFTNDLYPRSFNADWERVPTLVGRGSSIGAGAVILCGVVLGEFCMIGAGAVVVKDVPAHALIVGNPGRVAGAVCRCGRPLRAGDRPAGAGAAFVCGRCGAMTDIAPEVAAKVRP